MTKQASWLVEDRKVRIICTDRFMNTVSQSRSNGDHAQALAEVVVPSWAQGMSRHREFPSSSEEQSRALQQQVMDLFWALQLSEPRSGFLRSPEI
jgi:hypothetical protein